MGDDERTKCLLYRIVRCLNFTGSVYKPLETEPHFRGAQKAGSTIRLKLIGFCRKPRQN